MPQMRLAGHAVHPMLVVFPLGLLATSLAWDLLYLGTGNAMWAEVSFWTILAGLIGAVAAAIPGFIDWLGIPRHTRAWRVGLWHLGFNLGVIALFVLSEVARGESAGTYRAPVIGALILGWIGIGLAFASGWLGGELVQRLGVGVAHDANLDAPPSLGTSVLRPESVRGAPVPRGPREPTPSMP